MINTFHTINLKTLKKYKIPRERVYLICNTLPIICKTYLNLTLSEFEKYNKRELDKNLIILFEATYVYLINEKPLHVDEGDYINDSYIGMIQLLKWFNPKKGNWQSVVELKKKDFKKRYAKDYTRKEKYKLNINDFSLDEFDENFSEKNHMYKQDMEAFIIQPNQEENLI